MFSAVSRLVYGTNVAIKFLFMVIVPLQNCVLGVSCTNGSKEHEPSE